MGGWTSILLFRRPFMGLLNRAFNFVDLNGYSPAESKVVGLPRRIATELCLVSVMAPIISSDLSAHFFPEVFATDASNERLLLRGEMPKLYGDAQRQKAPTPGFRQWRRIQQRGLISLNQRTRFHPRQSRSPWPTSLSSWRSLRVRPRSQS